MSASERAVTRCHPTGNPRIAAYLAVPVILALLGVGVVSAELPPGVTRVSAADAERMGSAVHLRRQAVRGAMLVQVEAATKGMSLLAVAADGAQVALADQLGDASGSLTLAQVDGEQLRIAMPGLLAAAFASDGTWLAVIDGRGALWRVDAVSGWSALLADGPFIGSPLVEADGSVVVLAVPSVQAPYESRIIRLAPTTGAATPLSGEDLVYGAFPLDGGDLAIVAHRVGGNTVRRISGSRDRLVVDLGPGAVNVVVAGNGRIAYERNGEEVYLVDTPTLAARLIGAGSRPCFGPDGSSILVRRGDQALALDLDGSVLAVVDEPSGYAGSAGCLP